MPSPEERKVMHLANIGNYMHDLVKVMTAVNQNLVELGKILKESDESYEQIVSSKGPMMVPREAEDIRFVDDKPLIESDRCGGCGLLYCEIEDCGSPNANEKEGE